MGRQKESLFKFFPLPFQNAIYRLFAIGEINSKGLENVTYGFPGSFWLF